MLSQQKSYLPNPANSIDIGILNEINSRSECLTASLLAEHFGINIDLPDYLQNGWDVHGSHKVFYWTRSRGQGIIISSKAAAVVACYSHYMQKIVLIRPIGDLESIIQLINEVCEITDHTFGGETVLLRYCNLDLANNLRARGWRDLSAPLLPSAYADDETWPEVILPSALDDFPRGPQSRPVRKTILRYQDRYEYRAENKLVLGGEAKFILEGSSRSTVCDSYEYSFTRAIISFLEENGDCDLTYHYLLTDSEMAGFGITGNTTGISHCYYAGVRKLPRLSTYFLWQIYLNERHNGATALNLGGSETRSLHQYKAETFPDHSLQYTHVLERQP